MLADWLARKLIQPRLLGDSPQYTYELASFCIFIFRYFLIERCISGILFPTQAKECKKEWTKKTKQNHKFDHHELGIEQNFELQLCTGSVNCTNSIGTLREFKSVCSISKAQNWHCLPRKNKKHATYRFCAVLEIRNRACTWIAPS